MRSNIALVQKKVNNDISSGDLLGEEFEEEYRKLCAQVDKVTLKLFATTVEAGKLERALDLVDRLQLEKSYDLAMVLAEQHNKLVDFIEDAKESKFGGPVDDEGEDEEVDEGDGEYDTHHDGDIDHRTSPPNSRHFSSQRISPEAGHGFKSKRSLGEPFGLQGRNVRPKAY